MKLSDGRNVTMHESPLCEERDKLSSECSRLLAEWLAHKDQVKQTKKNDVSYGLKVEQMNEAHRRLNATTRKLNQHTRTHRCWWDFQNEPLPFAAYTLPQMLQ
jgi:hypothetical protein